MQKPLTACALALIAATATGCAGSDDAKPKSNSTTDAATSSPAKDQPKCADLVGQPTTVALPDEDAMYECTTPEMDTPFVSGDDCKVLFFYGDGGTYVGNLRGNLQFVADAELSVSEAATEGGC